MKTQSKGEKKGVKRQFIQRGYGGGQFIFLYSV